MFEKTNRKNNLVKHKLENNSCKNLIFVSDEVHNQFLKMEIIYRAATKPKLKVEKSCAENKNLGMKNFIKFKVVKWCSFRQRPL